MKYEITTNGIACTEITVNGTTFTEITYRMHDEDVEQYGLLIHDESDINRDGDMIVGCDLPNTVDEAETILANETGLTAFHVEGDMYIID